MPLILASTSEIRRALLDAAGVPHAAQAPDFEEAEAKCYHRGDAPALARRLAESKSRSLAVDPGDWVIGADSVLEVNGRLYSKPRDRTEAAAHLAAFSGSTMVLTSAAALIRDGIVEWSCADSARLKVRSLSPSFIESYLDAEWPAVAYCVGVFRMEGRGVQLFDSVEGNHFTILGLPLLPLLDALRQRGVMPS